MYHAILDYCRIEWIATELHTQTLRTRMILNHFPQPIASHTVMDKILDDWRLDGDWIDWRLD